MNALMKQFEQNLYQLINNCNLQIGEAYYILKCVFLDLEHLYENSVQEDLNGTTKQTKTETINIPTPEDASEDLTPGLEDGQQFLVP